ncbi:MAG: helix-turn-helix domain-containing protein [Alphaproteobacteria bacterium]
MGAVDRIREAIAFEMAENAVSRSPDSFLHWALDRIAETSPWQRVFYGCGSIRNGLHFALDSGLGNEAMQHLRDGWRSSSLSVAGIRYAGQPLILTETLTDAEIQADDYLTQSQRQFGVLPVAFISGEGAFAGLTDTLQVLANPGEVANEGQKELLWQMFAAIRLGLRVSVQSTIKEVGSASKYEVLGIVDQLGFSYGKSNISDDDRESIVTALTIAADLDEGSESQKKAFQFDDLVLTPLGPLCLVQKERQLDVVSLLSPREREIAKKIAQGKTYKTIAADLGIAVSTVSNLTVRIRRKLDLGSREEIAALFN